MLPLCGSILDQVGHGRKEVASFSTSVQPAVAHDHAAARQAAQELDRATNLPHTQQCPWQRDVSYTGICSLWFHVIHPMCLFHPSQKSYLKCIGESFQGTDLCNTVLYELIYIIDPCDTMVHIVLFPAPLLRKTTE